MHVDTGDDAEAGEESARAHAFGAQFVEVRVDADTGEVRVPRVLGVFACGRIINPKTARSQLIGGMTMGISMALLEESVLDPRSATTSTTTSPPTTSRHTPTSARSRRPGSTRTTCT